MEILLILLLRVSDWNYASLSYLLHVVGRSCMTQSVLFHLALWYWCFLLLFYLGYISTDYSRLGEVTRVLPKKNPQGLLVPHSLQAGIQPDALHVTTNSVKVLKHWQLLHTTRVIVVIVVCCVFVSICRVGSQLRLSITLILLRFLSLPGRTWTKFVLSIKTLIHSPVLLLCNEKFRLQHF